MATDVIDFRYASSTEREIIREKRPSLRCVLFDIRDDWLSGVFTGLAWCFRVYFQTSTGPKLDLYRSGEYA